MNDLFGENSDSQIKSHIVTIDNAINIVVLNTSIFSGQPIGEDFNNLKKVKVNDSKLIWLSEYELPEIDSIKDNYPTIVIGHHPLHMFDEHPRNMIVNLLNSVNTKYYFCGHIHQTENVKINNIEQIATSGLFKDDYNYPNFLLHSMDKSANEHIDTKIFKFENGNWKSINYKNNESNICHNTEEKSGIDEMIGKVTTNPAISDGAMRFKYNNGFFNLYITKARTSDYITPHLHKEMDEITYVSNGELFAYIDNDFFLVRKDFAILMPKSKLHSLIPASYPCDYITMGVEEGKSSNYESIWSEDINEILNLETKLENCEPTKIGNLCDGIIKYLNSSIMEVRWQAIDTLKRIIVAENETSTVCSSSIQTMISNMLLQKCDEKQLFGIEMASEFRSIIKEKTIEQLLTSKSNFMISWNCAYYLVNMKSKRELPKINLVSIFNKINTDKTLNINNSDDKCSYYERAIIALLRLMIDRKSDLLEKIYYNENYNVLHKNCMPLDDIIMHFVLWYTSYKYPLEQVNYTCANNLLMNYNISDESILRSLLDMNDYMERYKVLEKCKKEKKLLEVSKAYFESIEDISSNSSLNSLKNSISKYLRIIVSEKCNLNCLYCHHEGRINSLIGNNINNNSDFDIRTLLNEAKKCRFEKIKISGEEPLLYPNILETCNEFQNQFKDIGFTSNGTQIIKLKSTFERIKGSKLKFNITLNSLNLQKYEEITGQNCLEDVERGIDFLIDNGFSIKINSVITSYNFDDIVDLIYFAARKRVDIKFLDLFSIDGAPEKFQPVSIAEIKAKIQDLFKLTDDNFSLVDDYMSTNVMGIKVLIPKRIYSVDCIYNCTKYPCAEGLFGIRVYEDYSCAQCFNKEVLSGGIEKFSSNIDYIRDGFNKMSFSL